MNQVVSLVDRAEMDRRKEDAAMIREFADQVESGEITEIVIVANNREFNVFERFGSFRDRWRILGALEYAKTAIFQAE